MYYLLQENIMCKSQSFQIDKLKIINNIERTFLLQVFPIDRKILDRKFP